MKRTIALIITAVLLITMLSGCSLVGNSVFTASAGTYTSTPSANETRIYCGNTNELIVGNNEQYFVNCSDTAGAGQESGGRQRTFRYATDKDSYFTYKIPVDKKLKAPIYISMVTRNEISVSVDGKEIYTSGPLPYNYYNYDIPREFELTDSKIWADGYVEIKISNPSDEPYPTTVYSIDVGENAMYRSRLKKILYDASDVVFQMGYYDGTYNEFMGEDTQITIGEDFSQINAKDKITINYQLEKKEGVKYVVLAGLTNDYGTNYVDINCDGAYEYRKSIDVGYMDWPMERIIDIDVTDMVTDGENCLSVEAADTQRGFIDFVALVEVKEGSVDESTLRVQFTGSEMADNWTKLVNTSMYFTNELFIEQSSGWVGCSPPNGIYTNLYWTPDAFSIINELAAWGYWDVAQLGFMFNSLSDVHYKNDNGTAVSSTVTLGYLMGLEKKDSTFYNLAYSQIIATLDKATADIDSSAIGLLKGSNYEMAFGSYDIGSNTNAAIALAYGAELARKMGDEERANKYEDYSDAMFLNIEDRFIAKRDAQKYILKGTLYSGVTDTGDYVRESSGYLSTSSYIWNNSERFASLIDASAKTMNMIEGYWDNWLLYGNNRGYTTNYGCMAARGGVVPLAHLALDQVNLVKKTMDHVIFNSTDYNFENGNEGIQELSPWAIIRETHPQDLGVAPNSYQYIGNTPFDEDMNAIEFAVPLATARVMAGVDDGDGLKIIPKLPENWSGVKVNSWPVKTSAGLESKSTLLTYDYKINATNATMDIYTKDKVKDVYVRVGPFDSDCEIEKVSINGGQSKYQEIVSGGYKWVAVTTDTKASKTTVKVDIVDDKYILLSDKTLENSSHIFEDSATGGYIMSDVKLLSDATAGVSVADGANTYTFAISTKEKALVLTKNGEKIESFDMNLYNNRTYTLKIRVADKKLYCNLNGTDVITKDFDVSQFKYGLYANGSARFSLTTVRLN